MLSPLSPEAAAANPATVRKFDAACADFLAARSETARAEALGRAVSAYGWLVVVGAIWDTHQPVPV